MKILMIIDGLKSGGVERRMLSLVKKIEEKDTFQIEIIVLSTEIHYANDLNTLHSKIHIIERKPKKDPRVFLKIIKICRNFKP
ncbi:MAG: hypothetical protein HC905_28455, partial [Bacteroidales bacterium]|nr:hypothetical protein [Bacteroidales bacterium]